MFDESVGATIIGVLRAPPTDDEAAYRRRFYGLDPLMEMAQPRRVHEFMPRFLRRKRANAA